MSSTCFESSGSSADMIKHIKQYSQFQLISATKKHYCQSLNNIFARIQNYIQIFGGHMAEYNHFQTVIIIYELIIYYILLILTLRRVQSTQKICGRLRTYHTMASYGRREVYYHCICKNSFGDNELEKIQLEI